MIISTLSTRLSDHKKQQRYRHRYCHTSASKEPINFSSNDYLGLSQHPTVIAAFQKTAQQYGVGSGGSQLVSGYSAAHQDCELAFAEFLQRDRALLFSNGYMANLGIIDALTNREDHIYQDRYNHASLLDAGRLTYAQSHRYLHKNIADLNKKMAQHAHKKKLIASDGVFSIHGDITPLSSLVQLSQQHHATLMIDDAHGIGVLGRQGRGTLEHFHISQEKVPILVCPLGKAFGVYGAIVAGSHNLIESLIQFARSYIYTTALPAAMASAALKSLELVQKDCWRRDKLHHLIAFFRQAAQERGMRLLASNTAIQAIPIAQPEQAITLSKRLHQAGYWVYPMRPPSVPEGQTVLRITLNATHSETQIIALLDTIR